MRNPSALSATSGPNGLVSSPLAASAAVVRRLVEAGVLVSIGTAYLVMQFASIMDYVQALFSFFIAPLFGTVILGKDAP